MIATSIVEQKEQFMKIKRIYMKNYKLFDVADIILDDVLTVFDGPNGYGKTSFFDAAEYLITGHIGRIDNNDAINGRLSYNGIFLARRPDEEVILKGEFYDVQDNSIVIAIRIPSSIRASRECNPKSIESITETFILDDYDCPEKNWEKFKVSQDEANIFRIKHFGNYIISHFQNFYYVSQEDRLHYFKEKEESRATLIDGLIGLEQYTEKQKKSDAVMRIINNKIKEIDRWLENNKTDSIKEKKPVAYQSLTKKHCGWNLENIKFLKNGKFDQYNQIISAIKDIEALCNHKYEFWKDKNLSDFFKRPEQERKISILAWQVFKLGQNKIQELDTLQENNSFLEKTKRLITKDNFVEVDWDELCKRLNSMDQLDLFHQCVKSIEVNSENKSRMFKAVEELVASRNDLSEVFVQDKGNIGNCPYCGYDWGSHEKLQEQFESVHHDLEAFLYEDDKRLQESIMNCRKYYDKYLRNVLETFILKCRYDVELRIFSNYSSADSFIRTAKSVDSIMHAIGLQDCNLDLSCDYDKALENASHIISKIEDVRKGFSVTYVEDSKIYDFYTIYDHNFDSFEDLKTLTIDMLKQKINYIDYLFWRSFDDTRELRDKLSVQKEKLNNILGSVTSYHSNLVNSIRTYKQNVFSHIEIPFYLYTSRLLQSYQGGVKGGILIKTPGNGIRFTTPESDHDILYTMSSGQLSAVLLAFELVMNNIYGGTQFNTILIDDPIQSMDDINVVSFIELLIREFKHKQIIMSTHEESFSGYIRYKYQKHNLSSCPVKMKEISDV